jgi:hypothetical protein
MLEDVWCKNESILAPRFMSRAREPDFDFAAEVDVNFHLSGFPSQASWRLAADMEIRITVRWWCAVRTAYESNIYTS